MSSITNTRNILLTPTNNCSSSYEVSPNLCSANQNKVTFTFASNNSLNNQQPSFLVNQQEGQRCPGTNLMHQQSYNNQCYNFPQNYPQSYNNYYKNDIVPPIYQQGVQSIPWQQTTALTNNQPIGTYPQISMDQMQQRNAIDLAQLSQYYRCTEPYQLKFHLDNSTMTSDLENSATSKFSSLF